jgi:hypothetical protein
MAIMVSRCVAMFAILALADATGLAGRNQQSKAEDSRLIGTWRVLSGKYGGQEFKRPEGLTTVKHVTPTHFMWVTYDRNGKVTRAAGGRYTLKADTYEETPEYGIGEDFDTVKAKAQTFKWKVDGNKWYLDGSLSNGQTLEEVWERVEKK